jgi:hypothetical protein
MPRKIYSIAADGGDAEALTAGADWFPCWLADGNAIVFAHSQLFGTTINFQLQTLDLQTRRVSILPGPALHLGCSRDGRYISALTDDSQALKLFNTATREWVELAKGQINCPVWSRDSQYIYFDRLTGDAAISRVRISDHKLERVTSLEGFRRAQPAFLLWHWMGLGPDDAPLLVRDIGTQEIYGLDWEAP